MIRRVKGLNSILDGDNQYLERRELPQGVHVSHKRRFTFMNTDHNVSSYLIYYYMAITFTTCSFG